jgi:hypothetical protein
MATQASKADLVAALARVDGKAEIVGGEIVVTSPTGGLPSRAAAAIYRALWEHERRTRSGRAYADKPRSEARTTTVASRRGPWRPSARSTSPREPAVYRRGERAETAPALPGWTFSVDDLFE